MKIDLAKIDHVLRGHRARASTNHKTLHSPILPLLSSVMSSLHPLNLTSITFDYRYSGDPLQVVAKCFSLPQDSSTPCSPNTITLLLTIGIGYGKDYQPVSFPDSLCHNRQRNLDTHH